MHFRLRFYVVPSNSDFAVESGHTSISESSSKLERPDPNKRVGDQLVELLPHVIARDSAIQAALRRGLLTLRRRLRTRLSALRRRFLFGSPGELLEVLEIGRCECVYVAAGFGHMQAKPTRPLLSFFFGDLRFFVVRYNAVGLVDQGALAVVVIGVGVGVLVRWCIID